MSSTRNPTTIYMKGNVTNIDATHDTLTLSAERSDFEFKVDFENDPMAFMNLKENLPDGRAWAEVVFQVEVDAATKSMTIDRNKISLIHASRGAGQAGGSKSLG